jgi:RNA polymerase sigma factor (sigma-70 family)
VLQRLASDDRLVEQLRAGSAAAFEAIFDRHHRGVLAFCRHMLGSAEEAEDVVQQTFLAAYSDLVGSDKPIHLRPWLYTIARNRCLSVLRAPHRPVDADVEPPATEHLSAVVERRQDLRDLLGDLARLPDDQRAALVLAEVGDMSHEEIAGVLSCRREKVKALVFQARTSLIAGRTARETPCAEIREQLANLTGSALRRSDLRRHLHDCAGCREYRDQVGAQRRQLALVLPVAPTIGLKSGVLAGAGAAAAGGGAGAVAAGSGSLAAKALIAVALAGGGVAAVETAHEQSRPEAGGATRVESPKAPARGEGAAAVGTSPRPGRPAAVKAAERHGPKADKVRRPRKNDRRAGAKADKRRGPSKAEKLHPVNVRAAERRGPKPKTQTPRGPKTKLQKAPAVPPKPAKAQKDGLRRVRPRADRRPPARRAPRSPTRCGRSAGAVAESCADGR